MTTLLAFEYRCGRGNCFIYIHAVCVGGWLTQNIFRFFLATNWLGNCTHKSYKISMHFTLLLEISTHSPVQRKQRAFAVHVDQMLFSLAAHQTGSLEHLAWASNSVPNQNTRIRDMCTARNRLPARGSCTQANPNRMQQTKRMLETFASWCSQQVRFQG